MLKSGLELLLTAAEPFFMSLKSSSSSIMISSAHKSNSGLSWSDGTLITLFWTLSDDVHFEADPNKIKENYNFLVFIEKK